MTPLVIGVTSHRNILASELEPIKQRVREFLVGLRRDFPTLSLVLLSSLAEGGDQLVAAEALALGASVIAPLPLPKNLYIDDFEDAQARATLQSLCAQAQLVELPLLAGNSLHGIASPGPERDRQYAQAGAFIARHCHILLAIWDGKTSQRVGGTAQVVQFYLDGIMPGLIERRRGERRRLSGTGDERLLCQIVCSRAQADGAPAVPLEPQQVLWRARHSDARDTSAMPPAFHNMFSRMAEFDLDSVKYRARIEQGRLPAPEPSAGSPNRYGPVERQFHAADWLAMHFQRRVLLAMRTVYTLAALMGIAFMVYSDLPAPDFVIYVFLVLFAAGVLITGIANRRGWHRKYLDYRALAEGLRVQAFWRRAGISLTEDPEFAHDSFMQKQDIELGWIRNVMRSAGLEAIVATVPSPASEVEAVIRDWIGEPWQAGQLGYYQRKAEQRSRMHRLTEGIGRASLCVGIGTSIVLAVWVRHLSADAKTTLVAIMAAFSILAAVREAYAYRKADKELIKQYRFMQGIFADAHAALDSAADVAEKRCILRLLGEAALAEHVEWAMMHRQRPLEHGRF